MMVRDRLVAACSSWRPRALELGLEHANLFFGGDGIGLRRRQRRLGLQQVGVVLLRLLDGAAALLSEPLVALGFLLGKGQRGLRLRDLLVGLIDLGLLGHDLRLEIVDVGLRLIALRDVIAVVEADQLGAGLDQLVIRHRHVDDCGGDLGADLHRAGVDEGVVGRFVIAARAATTRRSPG